VGPAPIREAPGPHSLLCSWPTAPLRGAPAVRDLGSKVVSPHLVGRGVPRQVDHVDITKSRLHYQGVLRAPGGCLSRPTEVMSVKRLAADLWQRGADDGISVTPLKAQNMSLNSDAITQGAGGSDANQPLRQRHREPMELDAARQRPRALELLMSDFTKPPPGRTAIRASLGPRLRVQ
jgi:hypothetical protein